MRRINLIPPEIAARRRVRQQNSMLGVVFFVFLLLLTAIWFVRNGQLKDEQARVDVAQAEVEALEVQVAALQEFAQLEQTVKQKQQTLATAMVDDVAWSRLLIELSMIIPGDSWITAFTGAASSPTSAPPTGPAPTVVTAGPKLGILTFTAITVGDFPGVAKWITRLQELKSLQNIWVPSAAKSELAGRDTVDYSSTADLSKDSASGRYQQGGTP